MIDLINSNNEASLPNMSFANNSVRNPAKRKEIDELVEHVFSSSDETLSSKLHSSVKKLRFMPFCLERSINPDTIGLYTADYGASKLLATFYEDLQDPQYTRACFNNTHQDRFILSNVILPALANRSYCIRPPHPREFADIAHEHLMLKENEDENLKVIENYGYLETENKLHRMLAVYHVNDPSEMLGLIHFFITNEPDSNEKLCWIESLTVNRKREGLATLLIGCAHTFARQHDCHFVRMDSTIEGSRFYFSLDYMSMDVPYEGWSNLTYAQKLKFFVILKSQKNHGFIEFDLTNSTSQKIFTDQVSKALAPNYTSTKMEAPMVIFIRLPSSVLNWGLIKCEPCLIENPPPRDQQIKSL